METSRLVFPGSKGANFVSSDFYNTNRGRERRDSDLKK